MNLYDLVKRKDRRLVVEGSVESCEVSAAAGRMRAVRMAPGSSLRVRGADEAHCLCDLPSRPGWRASGAAHWQASVALEAPAGRIELASVQGMAGEETQVELRWPAPAPLRFDLVVRSAGGGELVLLIGPSFNSRSAVVPLLKGRGVEVGPGVNPIVRAAPGIDVRYVEKKLPHEWGAMYANRELTPEEKALWQHYVVDSARHLAQFADGSLDFIFSNHVFEHFVDPIGTLLRWWQRLAPGGVIAGVVPDMRFTFDWRQPAWEMADVRAQRGMESDEPTEAMYQRWCRYTSPASSPAALRASEYSVHVNYYTPALMRQVLNEVMEEIAAAGCTAADGVFLQSATNSKDFAFALRKSR